MEKNDKDNRAASGLYTRITVSLRHLQPSATKHLPDIDRLLLAVLDRKLATHYRWSAYRQGECVTVLRQGVAGSAHLMELNRYCCGVIDGYMSGRYDLPVHGIIPSFSFKTESLERIPDGFIDNEQ